MFSKRGSTVWCIYVWCIYVQCTFLGNEFLFAGYSLCMPSTLQPHAPKSSAAYYHKFRDEWREVFFISAEIYIFGAIIYLILGSGNKQPWADGSASKTRQRSTVATNMEVSGTNDISEKEYLINCARVDIQQQHEDIDT